MDGIVAALLRLGADGSARSSPHADAPHALRALKEDADAGLDAELAAASAVGAEAALLAERARSRALALALQHALDDLLQARDEASEARGAAARATSALAARATSSWAHRVQWLSTALLLLAVALAVLCPAR